MGDLHLDTTPTGGDGRYTITPSPDWNIWFLNGGYLSAIMLRAAGAEAQIRRPASIACHFLATGRLEPIELEVRTLFRGKRTESFHVTASQGGRAIVQAMVRTATETPGVEHNFVPMPEVPAPETLTSYSEIFADQPAAHSFWENFDGKPIDPERAKMDPEPRAPPLLEWHRYVSTGTFNDPFSEAARSLVLIDTLAWSAGQMAHGRIDYWGPNMDVNAYFYEERATDWLLTEIDSWIAKDGLVDTNSKVWASDGRLVATGKAQLMCLKRPPEWPQ